MAKNTQSKFDRWSENATHTCHQQIYHKLRNTGGAIQY